MTKDNTLLGMFVLSGIPSAPRGIPEIEVTFNIYGDSILTVTAQDNSTGKQVTIIQLYKFSLIQSQVIPCTAK